MHCNNIKALHTVQRTNQPTNQANKQKVYVDCKTTIPVTLAYPEQLHVDELVFSVLKNLPVHRFIKTRGKMSYNFH